MRKDDVVSPGAGYPIAVLRSSRTAVCGDIVADISVVGPVSVHDINLRASRPGRRESQSISVWRLRAEPITRGIVGQMQALWRLTSLIEKYFSASICTLC